LNMVCLGSLVRFDVCSLQQILDLAASHRTFALIRSQKLGSKDLLSASKRSGTIDPFPPILDVRYVEIVMISPIRSEKLICSGFDKPFNLPGSRLV